MTYNFDRDVIANGRGSLDFLQKLYETAGQCLQCGLRRCDPTGEDFKEFAKTALMVHKGKGLFDIDILRYFPVSVFLEKNI
jgi:hypothetical protein